MLLVQTPLTQSAGTVHIWPAAQCWQAVPPQSMSVSVPFFTPSAQPPVWQRPPEQTPLRQSVPTRQTFPSAHLPQVAPPRDEFQMIYDGLVASGKKPVHRPEEYRPEPWVTNKLAMAA